MAPEEKNGGVDRRKHSRAGIELEAVLRGETPDQDLRIEVVNFSVGGFYCKTSRPIELMTKLGIQFQFPAYDDVDEQAIEAIAVVVRTEPPANENDTFRLAACFVDMDRAARDHIEAYVEWFHSREETPDRQSA